MFIDGSNFVDDHLPLIRKLVWDFIKRQGGGVTFEELLPVAYEAARQAGETFDPRKGFVFATHVRERLRYALLDYLGDRNQVVKDMELPEGRYARAWGDPDAKPRGRTKKTRPLVDAVSYDENGNRVTRYATGPYRSSPQLIRGLGAINSKHNRVTVVPIQTQFGDGWHKPNDGTSWRRARVEDDGNQGVTDPRLVLWAGEKEAKGKEKVAPADYSDWKRIWAANYKRHNCRWFLGPTAPRAGTMRKDAAAATKATAPTFRSDFPYAFQPRLPGQAFLDTAQAAITQRIREREDRLRELYGIRDAKSLKLTPKVISEWNAINTRELRRRQHRERGDMRTELRLIARHVVTGQPIWAERAVRIMDKKHFEGNYYDPTQEVPAFGNLVEIKPLKRILSDKHLVQINRETSPWQPFFSTKAELWRHVNRWEYVREGCKVSLFLKISPLGRYNRQEQNSTTAPRPPVLAAALLGGSQSDRRASFNAVQSEVIEDILGLDILDPHREAAASTTQTKESNDRGRSTRFAARA